MQRSNAKITVLIPTYQRPSLLAQALSSAQLQTVSQNNYVILVVDNDPTLHNETQCLIEKMRSPNLRYIKNEKNLGGYGNWNRGFQLAETEWVCLLHDDDLILPSCIEKVLRLLSEFETPSLGAVIPRQCNLYDDPREEWEEEQEQQKNWKAKLDTRLVQKTANRLWKVGLFDNYMICSAYPALSGGALLRRSAVLELGGFGTKWPCEDIFFLNRLGQRYDCFLAGEQWGWYRFGANNIWAKPEEMLKWDLAKKKFREGAARFNWRCRLYHRLFGEGMCIFDRNETIRFARRRGVVLDASEYTWIQDKRSSKFLGRICRFHRNMWHIWMSVRAFLFGMKIEHTHKKGLN